MIIPEDGCLPPITSSNLNAFNNIMIVKVNDNSDGTTFQLATLDRSKKGTIWPADHYIDKLIPGLPEIKIPDEQKKELESRKELNLCMKTTTIKPKLFQQADQVQHHFNGTLRSNFPRKKHGPDRSEKFNKRFFSKSEIDQIEPWSQKPWENQPGLLPDPEPTNALLETPTNMNYNLPFIPNEGFYNFHPPVELDSVHHNLSSAHPSSFPKVHPGYIRDHSPNFNSYANKFDEINLAGPSDQDLSYYPGNNYRQNLRNRPNMNQRYKNKSVRGSRHDSSTFYRDNFDPSFVPEHDYSGNDGIGNALHISPNAIQKNYVPDSRHDPIPHSSFDNTEMENSVAYDNLGKIRNNSNNATYPMQHSRVRKNRKYWKKGGKFMQHANQRGNVNSLNPRINRGKSRGNVESSIPRENNMQRFNAYNTNQWRPPMANKAPNFNQTPYNFNQKVFKSFRGSNVRP